MNILITGGTGLIGRQLIASMANKHHITVLTRNITRAKSQLLTCPCKLVNDLNTVDFNRIDAVVNLAGEPIGDKRWSKKQQSKICNSRWQLTQELSEHFNRATIPPKILISGSAIGFYGRQGEQKIDEKYLQVHDEFTHQVCQRWECIAQDIASVGTRVCILRTGIVLSHQGGALAKMAMPFKFGLGATIGNGIQYMSWIHIDDMVRIIEYLLENNIEGVINATAPVPVTNSQFSKALATCLKRPCLFKIPTLMMKVLLGKQADLVIHGQRVIPQRLLDNGFTFHFADVASALENIYRH